ncbi:MAG: hypothetical protein SWY16_11595 [Cyanobacteriota bacterium]|nr:hypothetical protein [Cyanobacteriota bacterium]
MSRIPILESERSYTFGCYFEMPFEPDDILAEFGCSLERSFLELPQSNATLDRLSDLKSRIEDSFSYISLDSDKARRSFLIAPILSDLIVYTRTRLRVNYYIEVSDRLKGSLDYFFDGNQKLLVVAAQNTDLSRGFLQMALELIALDLWTDSDEAIFMGAISTGDIWQFGKFERETKQITQDLNLYCIPADLDLLLRILIATIDP